MAPEDKVDDSGTRPDEPAEGRPEGLDVIAGTQDHSLDTVRETSDEVIARRRGMFGVSGTGDTSGYGGLTRAVEMPGSTQPPFGGWMDDVAAGPGRGDPRRRSGERRREDRRAPRRDHLLRTPRGPAGHREGAA